MKTIVEYTYAPSLVARIFVATGINKNSESFVLEATQLTPQAREAALSALVVSAYSTEAVPIVKSSEWTSELEWTSARSGPSHVENLRAAHLMGIITVRPPPVYVEPIEAQAIADAEAALMAAADDAPEVLAQRDAIRKASAAKHAAKLEAAIISCLALPFSEWLETRDGVTSVIEYKRYRPEPLPSGLSDLRKLDPRLAARADEAEVEAKRINAERDAMAASNIAAERKLLAEYGTTNQVERFDAGKLPVEEFDRFAKAVLFSSLESCARYEKLTAADCRHDDGCDGSAKFKSVEYEGPLTSDQWDAVKRMSLLRPAGSECDVREHSVYCAEQDCKAGYVDRLGFRVTITWAGNKYFQEYAI